MKWYERLVLVCSAAVALVPGPAGAQGDGTVSGRVSGAADFGEAPAVIYLTGKAVSLPGNEEKKARMDQEDMAFVPFVLVVEVGTTVEFLNSDTVLHNVFTPSKVGDRFNLGTYGKGVVKTHKFDKPGEVVVLCNVHPEMEAYIYVVDTPFYAVSGADGSFTIEGIPEGQYELNVWHPRLKGKSSAIKVGAGATTTVEIVLR